MTSDQQAEYLKANGWKPEGEFWRDRHTTYLWEQSAAVKHQQFRDREVTNTDGNRRRQVPVLRRG